MKKLFIFFSFFFITSLVFSQTDTSSYRGTIKVQKKGNVFAIMYDEVYFRMIGKDEYGNMLDSCVVQFRIKTSIKGIAYDELINGNTLSKKMQYQLSRLDSSTTLFFSEIVVKTKDGTTLKWKDFKVKTGSSFEKEY